MFPKTSYFKLIILLFCELLCYQLNAVSCFLNIAQSDRAEQRNVLWSKCHFLFSLFHILIFCLYEKTSLWHIANFSLNIEKIIVIHQLHGYRREANMKGKNTCQKESREKKTWRCFCFMKSAFFGSCFDFGYQGRLEGAKSSGAVWPFNITSGTNAWKL